MSYDDSSSRTRRERRIEVAKAAWQVIIREGLDRTSMRAIAQELGSSTGVVTHYFRFSAKQQQYLVRRHINNLLTSS
jgi:AcrR family transcriptional regulator